MLSFSTEFPLSDDTQDADFLSVIRSWISNSPHSTITAEQLATIDLLGSSEIDVGTQSLSSLGISNETGTLCLIRDLRRESQVHWLTEIVYSRDKDSVWVGIQTSRTALGLTVKLPPAKKPVIVKELLWQLKGGRDGELAVQPDPHLLSNDDIPLAGRLMTGGSGCHLPIVYLSHPFSGSQAVDAAKLAWDLAGMAHVVVEPNRPFSTRLKIDVGSANVYGGAVGIYWSGGTGRQVLLQENFGSSKAICAAIVEDIRTALLNRRTLQRVTPTAVREAASKMAIRHLIDSGSGKVDEYIEAFDQTLKENAERLASAEAEISRLENELRINTRQSHANSQHPFDFGKEQDFFPGEISDVILDAIRLAASGAQSGSRRSHILHAVQEANKSTGGAPSRREKLKSLLRGYKSMDKDASSGLRELGFSISEEGKHYKLVYNDDGRYTFSLPKTGGDHRGGLNSVSDIGKNIF